MIETKDKSLLDQNVITMCKKCEVELAHVILFHEEAGIIKRVKCQACGNDHEYHPLLVCNR